ncbi:MAG: PAS domain S-box protein [Chlorobi bacterium]|nr:PAS domain S-box protein [Chlorobiota bacterium]
MSSTVKILILEDVTSDVFLLEYRLNKSEFNYKSEFVKTKPDFINALKNFKPDIILSDYHLPTFSGLEALETVKNTNPDTPFIFVTGVLDEKTAVKLLKKGAWDYILKDNLVRLVPAVESALILKRKNEEVKKTQKYLKDSRTKYLELYENAPDMFLTFDFNTGIISECNNTLTQKIGYKKTEIINHSISEFYASDNIHRLKNKYLQYILKNKEIENEEISVGTKKGDIIYGTINSKVDFDTTGLIKNVHITIRDITELKEKDKVLKESEKRFKMIFEKTSDPVMILDAELNRIPILKEGNSAAKQYILDSKQPYFNKPISILLPHIPEQKIIKAVNQIKNGETFHDKITLNSENSETFYFDVIANLIYLENRKHILITARDITEQYLAELKLNEQKETFKSLYKEYLNQNIDLEYTVQKLHKSQKELSSKIDIINRSPIVSFSWDNKPGWPVNYVSKNAEKIFGYSSEEFLNKDVLFEKIIHPEDLLRVKREIEKGSEKTTNYKVTHKSYRIITKNNTIKWVKDDTLIIRKNGEIINYEGIISDITENIKYQKALEASEQKYRTMLDVNPDLVIITSEDKKIQYMNPKAIQKFGNCDKETSCHKFLFNFDIPCSWCAQKDADIYENIQNEVIIPDDSKQYLVTFSKIQENSGKSSYLTSYKDVSELRQLQNERLQFLNALEVGLNEVYMLDQDFGIKYVNSVPVQNLGFSKSKFLKMKLYNFQMGQNKKTYKKYFNILKKGKEKEVYFETRHKRFDGTSYPASVYLKLIIQNSQIILLAFVNDISEKKQKDEIIKLLSTAITQSPTEVIITDIDGNINYVNPKFTEVTGYSASEVLGKNPRFMKSGRQSDKFYKEMWGTISSDKVWKGEFYNKKKNGEFYWENTVINPVKNENGHITHYIALKEDITEQKYIREKLIASELHFRLLFENSLIGMYLTTPEGTIVDANKALCKMLGYNSSEELKKINIAQNDEIIVNRKEFETEINNKGFVYGLESIWSDRNNKLIYVRENARKFVDKTGAVFYEGTVENITDVKLAERKLKETHEFNKHIIRVGNLGYAIYETDGSCIAANKTFAEIFETDVPELLKENFRKNKNWIKYQMIEIADKCLKYGERTKRIFNGKSVYNRNIWIEYNFSRIYKGNKPQLLIIIQNISSYMKAKRSQIQTKSEYINLIESVNVPIFGIDSDGKINKWNTAIENLTGYNRHEIKRKDIKRIFKAENDYVFQELINNALNGSTMLNEELDIISKKGKTIRLLLSSTLQINNDDRISGIVCVAQDITQREIYKVNLEKQIEERTHKLIQALKKEKELSDLKSQFVSMASHEFRTPLSAIKFAAGFINKYYDRAEKNKILEKTQKIDTQVNHMTSLLEDVLTIGKIESKKIKFEPKKLDLTEELKLMVEDVLIATKKTHKINFTFNDPKCQMISDDKILRNIFNNLLTNAVKFSPDASEVVFSLNADEKNVILKVTDKGIGIKPEELKDIFNPFRRGQNVETIQGTGLGLAIVKESIDLLKGRISVKSNIGKGTEFTVILPKKKMKK